MKRTLHATTLAVLLVASAGFAADGPIRLPTTPTVPQPMPAPPSPDAKVALAGDVWYVIDSKVECIVRGYPSGLVTVAAKKGPRDISAKFVDGNGTVEDRTYDGQFIYIVRASGKGDCSLVITPVGVKTGADILVASLAVDSGQGPIPPPKPPTPPIPPEPVPPKPVDPPSPPAPIPVAGLRVLIVYESADLPKMPPAQAAIIFGQQVRTWLLANCVVGPDGKTREVRMWDKDTATTGESKLWQDAFARPRQSVPWLIVSNGKTGFEGPLPANVDDFLALVKRYAN